MEDLVSCYEATRDNKRKDKKFLTEALKNISDLIHLVKGLLKDPRVSTADKVILFASLMYYLNPMDFIPDLIPFLGTVDDIFLLALSLLRLLHNVDIEVLKDHWRGTYDLPTYLKKIAEISVRFLPQDIKTKLLLEVKVPNFDRTN